MSRTALSVPTFSTPPDETPGALFGVYRSGEFSLDSSRSVKTSGKLKFNIYFPCKNIFSISI